MTDASPRFRAVLDGFPAYQPGRTPVSATGKSHKLSSNECPFAPLPSVIDVIAEEARSVHRYPDNGAEALTQAIAASYELNSQVTRLTDRLIQYRQLVDSGTPENADTKIAPPSSLLPLP